MNKTNKSLLILMILIIGILTLYYLINPLFAMEEPFNGFSGDNTNNTIIICASTGDMKGLEIGAASYAGNYGIPLILASKSVPYPLNEWIPLFKEKANIKKVIVVGPVSDWQIYSLKLLNLKVEQINGSSKEDILTQMAEKSYKSLDTVIITSSDPSASFLGAVMDVPVLVVAEPGKYTSADEMPQEYDKLISQYNIKRVIILGNVSSNIKNDLNSKKLVVEEINGNNSFRTSIMVSDRIIEIQKQRGIEVNSAYCGFYGELPSIVPLAVKNHSIIIQDPTLQMDETVAYLKNKGINDVTITRNAPADYIQMEEPDFVSSKLNSKLLSNGINTSSLTNFRTINEATGLYDTKIKAAQILLDTGNLTSSKTIVETSFLKNIFYESYLKDDNIDYNLTTTSKYPPLLDIILNGGNWDSSTGSQLTIQKIGQNEWFYDWKGIHPYIWQEYNGDWYCFSGSAYSWHWIHSNEAINDSYVNNINQSGDFNNNTSDIWTVDYLSNGKVYYRIYWVKKGDSWDEIHSEASYKWKKIGNSWVCTQNGNNQSFNLTKVFFEYPSDFFWFF